VGQFHPGVFAQFLIGGDTVGGLPLTIYRTRQRIDTPNRMMLSPEKSEGRTMSWSTHTMWAYTILRGCPAFASLPPPCPTAFPGKMVVMGVVLRFLRVKRLYALVCVSYGEILVPSFLRVVEGEAHELGYLTESGNTSEVLGHHRLHGGGAAPTRGEEGLWFGLTWSTTPSKTPNP